MINLIKSDEDNLSSVSEVFYLSGLWFQDYELKDNIPEQIQTQTDMIVYHTYVTILSIYEFNHLR